MQKGFFFFFNFEDKVGKTGGEVCVDSIVREAKKESEARGSWSLKSLIQSISSCTLALSGYRSQCISILPKLIQDEFLNLEINIHVRFMIINANEFNSLSKKSKTQIPVENISSFMAPSTVPDILKSSEISLLEN